MTLAEINRYELIIYWSKANGSFVVEVPELPGCMADGQTYAEAVVNAELVINETRPSNSRAARKARLRITSPNKTNFKNHKTRNSARPAYFLRSYFPDSNPFSGFLASKLILSL